jgi:hypothetical protein
MTAQPKVRRVLAFCPAEPGQPGTRRRRLPVGLSDAQEWILDASAIKRPRACVFRGDTFSDDHRRSDLDEKRNASHLDRGIGREELGQILTQ